MRIGLGLALSLGRVALRRIVLWGVAAGSRRGTGRRAQRGADHMGLRVHRGLGGLSGLSGLARWTDGAGLQGPLDLVQDGLLFGGHGTAEA